MGNSRSRTSSGCRPSRDCRTRFTGDLPGDDVLEQRENLFVTSGLRTDYQLAAETLGPMAVASTAALAQDHPNNTGNDPLTFIRNFGKRAFRRP